jgi:hypothetical protein
MGHIDLDPCSNSHESPNVPAKYYYTKEMDGLSLDWFGNVYMNPPYGREIIVWVDYLVDQLRKGNIKQAIALLPARTDTKWFQRLSDYPVCFVNGRLKFGDATNSAPFPSAIFALGISSNKFAQHFEHIGRIYSPVTPGEDEMIAKEPKDIGIDDLRKLMGTEIQAIQAKITPF